jgi:hypothetical protein
MNRRDFLKFSSLLFAVFFVQVHPLGKKISSPIEVQTQGITYRGTKDGRIFVSVDGGRNWQRHTQLGADYSIQEIFLDQSNQVRAQVGFAGRSFDLVLSQNGSFWQTA